MKKSNQAILLVIFLFTGFIINGCSTSTMDHAFIKSHEGIHTIILQVNTKDIRPNTDVEKYVSFVGQPPGSSAEDFISNISEGDTIIWIGMSTSYPYKDEVSIEQINYHGGDNFFDTTVMKGINGRVMGVITNEGKEEKYVLRFKVIKPGPGLGPNYNIDPKLRVL